MRLLVKALLAATTLIPVATAASAQDRPRWNADATRGDRGDRPDRGERPNGGNRDAGGERAAERQVPTESRWADANRQAARGGDWNARQGTAGIVQRDATPVQPRASVNVDAAVQARPAFSPEQRGWNGQRDARSTPAYDGNRQFQAGSRDDRRAGNQPGVTQQRYDNRGNWNQPRADQQRYDNGGDWNRSRDQRQDRRYENGGNWNRTWRNDRQYDWSRYRNDNRTAYRLPRYYAPSNWSYGYRRFSVGVTLSSLLWDENYWIEDPYEYRLPAAYGPYRWVRYYNDALLVDIRYGRVVDVVYDIFW